MPDKPGWKTTEFWLTLVATIGVAILNVGLLPDGSIAVKITMAIVAALAALGYTAGRTYVKIAVVDKTISEDAVRIEQIRSDRNPTNHRSI